MTTTPTYFLNQIVWAKTYSNNLQPAKIISIEHGKKCYQYELVFFADLPKCFVQGQDLVDFRVGFGLIQHEYARDFLFKNVVQLAMEAYEKTKLDLYHNLTHYQTFSETQPTNLCTFQQSKFDHKITIENIQKYQQQQNTNKFRINQLDFEHLSSIIDSENVIEHLTSKSFNQLKKSKGNLKRRQFVALEDRFQRILLEKYQLGEIRGFDDLGMRKMQVKAKICKKNEKKHNRKNTKKQNIINRSVKKLHKILRKRLDYSSSQSQTYLLDAFSHITDHTKSSISKLYRKLLHNLPLQKSIHPLTINQQTSEYDQIVQNRGQQLGYLNLNDS